MCRKVKSIGADAMRNQFYLCLIVGSFCISGLVATAQQAIVEPAADTAAVDSDDATSVIKEAIQSYVAAFNARDVAKLVSLWSPEGVYASSTTGDETVGRDAMTASLNEMFKNAETAPTLSVDTLSIEFVSPNVAMERGTATVTRATGESSETDYSVVYVKRDGAWLIDRVTEEAVEPTHYDQLNVLEGFIGDWVGEGEGYRVEISNQWTAKQNFIASQFKLVEDEVESSGLQIIGWDEKEKMIRSWLFDSDGGVVTGTWTKRDDGWSISSVATLGGGESGSFTGILRLKDDGNLSWEKINQVVDGQLLPNIEEIVLNRQ
jgi:uncharacterized protein (TIGR02246 family)